MMWIAQFSHQDEENDERKIHNQKGMLYLEERDYDETDKWKDSSEISDFGE